MDLAKEYKKDLKIYKKNLKTAQAIIDLVEIYNDEKKVRQSIQHPEREDGQEINKSVNYIIHYL